MGSDLTDGHFRHLAAISRLCDAIVFSIPRGGRQARVFADGQLVGRYANGAWQPEKTAQIDASVEKLASQQKLDLALLRRLLRCAFKLSERNQGAILLLGDADEILRRSDSPEIRNIAKLAEVHISELSDEELIALARQDGATVIGADGLLRGSMILLRPAASTQVRVGAGRGARHSSAAKMSAEVDCIAITVSHDGPITVYAGGRRVLSL
jgi:DNA integrity scanning protein DisA with diadenylate cyclase activity